MKDEKETYQNSYNMLKCVWMESNVIDYKLCDKKFDCENCQFYKVMKNLTSEVESSPDKIQNLISSVENKINSIKFDEKFTYLRNCFIMKQVLPNTYYLGVNPIFISFLDNVGINMKYDQGKSFTKGQQVVQFFDEWGTISLKAPMNFSIYDKVQNNSYDLIRSKWIAIICAIPQDVSVGCIDKQEWNKLHKKSLEILAEIKSDCPQVGPTMMDGGKQIKYLHQLTGKEKFLRILNYLTD
jgi:hypothetical protein